VYWGFLDDVWDENALLTPTRGVVAVVVEEVEVRKEGARLELTEPLRERAWATQSWWKEVCSLGAVRPGAELGWCIVGGGIAVEEVAHCLVEIDFVVFAVFNSAGDFPFKLGAWC
jgi:hypothetical protein